MDYSINQQAVIDFLETQKNSGIDLSNSNNFAKFKAELNEKLLQLSLKIPNQSENAVSLFYAGDAGTGQSTIKTWKLAVGMGEGNPNQVVVLQDTELGKLMNQQEFNELICPRFHGQFKRLI